jgi:oxygen-independent coproporphyrinogen-3 oxidase
MDDYTESIIRQIDFYGERLGRRADTLYFGGGTPSLLGAARLNHILAAARRSFGLSDDEITAEVNPSADPGDFFMELRAGGFNRVSVGLQSADDGELRLLGRGHTAAQAARTVEAAQKAGFGNLSLDLMLAVQGQTEESLARSAAFCGELGAKHVSAYLLQIEPGTVYARDRERLDLPGEEKAASLYLLAVSELEKLGYRQYEISNFARPGYESRHNLKYWHCEEYLGIGPSAHSFADGKRFHYGRSLRDFLRGEPPVQDGEGGDFEEYAMLRLRLTEGLTDEACLARFGHPVPERMKAAARRYETGGLTVCAENGFRFTPEGFLLSDALTAEILFAE